MLWRNYSRLVPDSLSNYCYYFALLSIEHILHCRLAVRMVFFFLLTNQLHVFWFFSIGMTRLAFSFFFQYIFFPLDSDLLHIFIFESLAGFLYRKGYYLIYIYIYIYCHPQTDCFVVSQLFSVARHVGRLKLGSKPTQLYIRLSIRLLGQQAYHIS